MRGADEAFEEWMRLMRFAVEFGMELAGDEKWMLRQFDDFDELAVRREPAENVIGLLEPVAEGIVELVPVPMSFVHHECSVKARDPGPHNQLTRLRAQPHGAAFLRHSRLLVQHRGARVMRV